MSRTFFCGDRLEIAFPVRIHFYTARRIIGHIIRRCALSREYLVHRHGVLFSCLLSFPPLSGVDSSVGNFTIKLLIIPIHLALLSAGVGAARRMSNDIHGGCDRVWLAICDPAAFRFGITVLLDRWWETPPNELPVKRGKVKIDIFAMQRPLL